MIAVESMKKAYVPVAEHTLFVRIFGNILDRRACLRRLKPFFEEGFKNPKNFKKGIIENTGGKQVP